MTAIFITATGSDVGKTQVVASLIRQFRQMGRSVEAIKPIVSGYDPAQAAASDTGILISALALPFTPESVSAVIAGGLLAEAASPTARELIARIVTGDCRAAFAFAEPHARYAWRAL